MERQTLYRGMSILRATLDECSSILTRGPDGAEWQEVLLQGKIRQVMLTDQEFAALQNHLLTERDLLQVPHFFVGTLQPL